jgi:carbonic anhydrase
MNRKIGLGIAVLVAAISFGTSASAQEHASPDFSYSGDTGRGFWPEMSPGCAPSARQSPIDIGRVVTDPKLGPLDLKTAEASFRMSNTGYTVAATPATGGGTLTANGQSFVLARRR